MLSALFGISEYFILGNVQFIKLLRNCFPVFNLNTFLGLFCLLSDDVSEKNRLLFTPVVCGQIDFFKAQPFEHTRLGRDTRYQSGQKLPILMALSIKNVLLNLFLRRYKG